MSNPLVSVIVPVYNGEKHIADALDSILGQSFQDFEVIVINDGSTDNSAKIIQSYPNVKYFFQENAGPGAARNVGLDNASGAFVAFLDQDDMWTPNKLEVQIEYMKANPNVGYTFAKQKVFTDSEKNLPKPLQRWLKTNLVDNVQTGYLPGTLVVRASVFQKLGHFDTSYSATSDFDFFFRLKDAKIKHDILPDILLNKRFHENNQCYDTKLADKETLRLIHSSLRRMRNPELDCTT